jgi:hypothetical protein
LRALLSLLGYRPKADGSLKGPSQSRIIDAGNVPT